MGSYEEALSVANFIKSKVSVEPKIGIVCGSGLGTLAETVTDAVVVTLPIRVMKLLGVEHLILTNAAGSLNPEYNVGDIMIIKDHISLLSLTGKSPLAGPNDDRFGPRFPSMCNAYPKQMRNTVKEIAKQLGVDHFVREGVYVAQFGPAYETPAESRFLLKVGADAAGMSTVHESTVANHAGMKVFAMSLITNKILLDESVEATCCHEEVLEMSAKRSETMKALVTKLVETL
ncbi:unnamed protein product [Mesocestoides corti]|uniref:purine-nucleoside phosphorylase n=1 Tax=Mesocestoides corti TaxID=53468 RepID=A0A0R3U516_MESCO|nr:unnamed protein product [Mesocestoides corti]